MMDNVVLLENEQVLCRPSLCTPPARVLTFQQVLAQGELLGQSPALQQLRGLVRKAAHTDATVLLRGESGAGKVFIARQIVREGNRAGAPFIHVNCASLPEWELAISLFGAQPGDGLLDSSAQNCFQMAQGGTLLLEEIGVLPLATQAKLLQVLQTQQLDPGPGGRPTPLDVRLISTTNRPLEAKVQQGEFREDLFNALNIMPITAPPLRARREDIPALAEHFRQLMTQKYGIEDLAISLACLQALQDYAWPGNVRELQLVLERAVLLCGGGVLEPHHLNAIFQTAKPESVPVPDTKSEPEDLGQLEKQHIFTVLGRCNNNRTHAAKRMGISVRTLRNKLREYREAAAQS